MKILAAILACAIMSTSAEAQTPIFNHQAIFVVNLKAATDFYRDVVGLPLIPEPFHDNKHSWFKVGPSQALHVIEGAKEKAVHHIDIHFCLAVPNINDFIKRLDARQIPFGTTAEPTSHKIQATRTDGVKQIYFQDPDGYWIEINDDYPKAGA